MNAGVLIRRAQAGEEGVICALVARVFNRFVALDYPQEGIEEFYAYANPEAMQRRAGSSRILLVAELQGELCGMIEVRGNSHLSLLFVERQGRGAGRALFQAAVRECRRREPGLEKLTVNSSPYAKAIYEKFGFAATGPSQTRNGITFIPMICSLDGSGRVVSRPG
jgi:GNAT superfamily N-acetyltransferase